MNIIFKPFVIIAEYIIQFWTWLTTKREVKEKHVELKASVQNLMDNPNRLNVKEITSTQADSIRNNNDLLVQLGMASGYASQNQLAAQQNIGQIVGMNLDQQALNQNSINNLTQSPQKELIIPTALEIKEQTRIAKRKIVDSQLQKLLKKTMDSINVTSQQGRSEVCIGHIDEFIFQELQTILKTKGYSLVQNSMTLEWFVRW